MKFKIVDRKKTGFARYCPTFARAYQVMAEKIRRRRLVKNLAKDLAKDLGSENPDVRHNAAWILGSAALEGVDISDAVGALGKALDDGYVGVRRPAARALAEAAEKGVDVSGAVGALVKVVVDENPEVRRCAAWALGDAVANEKIREGVVREILKFMNSSWFMQEAEKNSDAFIDVVDELDEVLRRVKAIEAEREVA